MGYCMSRDIKDLSRSAPVLRMVEYEAAAGKTPADVIKIYESALKSKLVNGLTADTYSCVVLQTKKGIAFAFVLPSEAELDKYMAGLREELIKMPDVQTHLNIKAQPILDHSAKIEFIHGSLPKAAPFGFARFLQYKVKPGKLAVWNTIFDSISQKVATIPGLLYTTYTAATVGSMQTTMMMIFKDKAAAEQYSATSREVKDAADLTGPAKGAQLRFMLEADAHDIIVK